MKKKTLALLLCAALAVVFTACGGSNPASQAEAQPQETSVAAAAKIDKSSAEEDDLISEDEAIEIVTNRVPGSSAKEIKSFELEYDDGRWQYEGELVHKGVEYEFEIDAQNGNVLDWETDD